MSLFRFDGLNTTGRAQTCLPEYASVLTWARGYLPAGELDSGALLVSPGGLTSVSEIKRFRATRFVRINESLDLTGTHPLLTCEGRWTPAGELVSGEWIMGEHGPLRIFSIEAITQKQTPVLDIVTDAPFFVDGYVTMSKSVFLDRVAPGIVKGVAWPQLGRASEDFGQLA